MATKITLTVDDTLTAAEQSMIALVFADALGEFSAKRHYANDYVAGRYPSYGGKEHADKVTQVLARTTLARKLFQAVFYARCEDGVAPSLEPC